MPIHRIPSRKASAVTFGDGNSSLKESGTQRWRVLSYFARPRRVPAQSVCSSFSLVESSTLTYGFGSPSVVRCIFLSAMAYRQTPATPPNQTLSASASTQDMRGFLGVSGSDSCVHSWAVISYMTGPKLVPSQITGSDCVASASTAVTKASPRMAVD